MGIERWEQRESELASLLAEHPVAVSRWVAEAVRRRTDEADFGEQMARPDEGLSKWALAALENGSLARRCLS